MRAWSLLPLVGRSKERKPLACARGSVTKRVKGLSWMGMFRAVLPTLAFFLVACGHHFPAEPGKRYPMQGVVKAIDPVARTAAIDAGQIGDWMAPMTMEYPVKPDKEFLKLHVDDRIEATVVVNEPSYFVTDVKIVAKP